MSNIKFYNTNDLYGDSGPFEAESKDAVADELFGELFRQWADDVWASSNIDEADETEAEWKSGYMAQMREELISGLVAQYHGEPRLIFDNGGGITLQLPGFAHYYDDAEQCAEDIKAWVEDGDTDGWDGNEEESVFEPTTDEISNGGYHVVSLSDFMQPGKSDLHGNNVNALRAYLHLHGTGFFYNWYCGQGAPGGNEWISCGFEEIGDYDSNGNTISRKVQRELTPDELVDNAEEIWECYAGECHPETEDRAEFEKWVGEHGRVGEHGTVVAEALEWRTDRD